MKILLCLLIIPLIVCSALSRKFIVWNSCMTISLSHFILWIAPFRDCRWARCGFDSKICPDGTRAPVPPGGCCPSLRACKRSMNCGCTFDLKICPDGTPAPVPPGECCPSYKACKPKKMCQNVFCTLDLKICPDGTPAPVPPNGCCPSLKACRPRGNRFWDAVRNWSNNSLSLQNFIPKLYSN